MIGKFFSKNLSQKKMIFLYKATILILLMSVDDERKRYMIHRDLIDYCQNNDMNKITETLSNHKIAMQTPPPHNYGFKHPICAAASYGHLDLVKYFLAYCKEINEPYDLEKYIIYVIYDAWSFQHHISIMFYIISIYEEYTGKHLYMNKIAYTPGGHPLNDCNIYTMIFWTVLYYGSDVKKNNINMNDMNKFLSYIYNQAESVNVFVDFNYMNNGIFTNACKMGNMELVKFMIENTSDKNIKRIKIHNNGEGAFGHACMSGNLELVKYLINIPINYSSRKIKLNAIFHERDGHYTPFSIAIMKGHLHIAKYLEEIAEGYYGKKLNIYKDTRILSFAKSLPENMQIDTLKWLLDLSKLYGKPYDFNDYMHAIKTPKLFFEYLQLYEHHTGLPYVITEKLIRGYMFDYYYDTLRYIMKRTKNIHHHININIDLTDRFQPCDLLTYQIKMPLYAAQLGWVNMMKGSMVQRFIKDEHRLVKYWYKKLIVG